MQKGVNLGGQNCTIKLGGPKSHNYETWGVKIAQLKLGGPKSHNCETWGAKTAFKPILFYIFRDMRKLLKHYFHNQKNYCIG
jgi:hypothetical protein